MNAPLTNRRPPGTVRWAVLCIALAGAILVWIGCGTPRAFSDPTARTGPQALVERTTERVLAVLKEQHKALQQQPSKVYDLVEQVVLPYFDFDAIARLALGQPYRTATPSQRRRFTRAFRTFLVHTYATALLQSTNYSIRYLPMRGGGNSARATVRSELSCPEAAPIHIDYRLRKKGGKWKVYDVVVEGMSLVTNYRATFRHKIEQTGMDGLIHTLEEHNRKPPGNGSQTL